MQELLLSAMEGARNIVKRQTVNMNNLANVSTDGFRKEIALIQTGDTGNRGIARGVKLSNPTSRRGPCLSSIAWS